MVEAPSKIRVTSAFRGKCPADEMDIAKKSSQVKEAMNVIMNPTKKVLAKVHCELQRATTRIFPAENDAQLTAAAREFKASEKGLGDLSTTKIGHISTTSELSNFSIRSSGLTRSLSLTDLLNDVWGSDDEQESKPTKPKSERLIKPVTRTASCSKTPRRKQHMKKRVDLLSTSEHTPHSRSSSLNLDSSLKYQKKNMQQNADRLPTIERSTSKQLNGLRQSEDVVSQNRRSMQTSDPADVNIAEALSDLSKGIAPAGAIDGTLSDISCNQPPKMVNPHFSFNLSQLNVMENLLEEGSPAGNPQRASSKTGKLRNVFQNVKKVITGGPKTKAETWQDSMRIDTSLQGLDDSYQEDFAVVTSAVDSSDSHLVSESMVSIDEDDEDQITKDADDLVDSYVLGEGRPPLSSRRLSTSESRVNASATSDRRGSDTKPTSARSLVRSSRRSLSISQRRSAVAALQATSTDESLEMTPKPPRRASSFTAGSRRPSSSRKAASWEELYNQAIPTDLSSPKGASPSPLRRRSSARVRPSSRKNLYAGEVEFVSPSEKSARRSFRARKGTNDPQYNDGTVPLTTPALRVGEPVKEETGAAQESEGPLASTNSYALLPLGQHSRRPSRKVSSRGSRRRQGTSADLSSDHHDSGMKNNATSPRSASATLQKDRPTTEGGITPPRHSRPFGRNSRRSSRKYSTRGGIQLLPSIDLPDPISPESTSGEFSPLPSSPIDDDNRMKNHNTNASTTPSDSSSAGSRTSSRTGARKGSLVKPGSREIEMLPW